MACRNFDHDGCRESGPNPAYTHVTASEEARHAGIDLSLIEVSLGYSYDKRALQHQTALELALELERIGRELHGATQPTDRAPS
jgi:hypothetical protein